jgi:hypothetical protein
MELFIDLFIKFVIGLTIAGFANFRSFAEMPSRPVAFFEFALKEKRKSTKGQTTIYKTST